LDSFHRYVKPSAKMSHPGSEKTKLKPLYMCS
jgi:hypothetical protein